MSRSNIPDVHCHLEMVRDPDKAVADALEHGVGPILTVGMEQTSSEKNLDIRSRHPGQVLVGVGLHPSEIVKLDDRELKQEMEFVRAALPDADVLGEVGLDFKDAEEERQRVRQRQALAQQLEWAAQFRKPVSMHCRRAERDLLEVAADWTRRTGLGVNLHWFTHSAKLARECAAAGLYISPGPSILHSESQAEVSAIVDADWLLLETDSPVEYGGHKAKPSWALKVAKKLADLRGESLDDLAARLQANFERYLRGGATPAA